MHGALTPLRLYAFMVMVLLQRVLNSPFTLHFQTPKKGGKITEFTTVFSKKRLTKKTSSVHILHILNNLD
jgi:hypothetical protein